MFKKLTIGGNNIVFECSSRSTRNGFAHDVELKIDGHKVSEAHVNYYNRTWESYQYETAMKTCIRKLIDGWYDQIRRYYKATRGIKRLAGKSAEEFKKIADNNGVMAFYRKIYDAL